MDGDVRVAGIVVVSGNHELTFQSLNVNGKIPAEDCSACLHRRIFGVSPVDVLNALSRRVNDVGKSRSAFSAA